MVCCINRLIALIHNSLHWTDFVSFSPWDEPNMLVGVVVIAKMIDAHMLITHKQIKQYFCGESRWGVCFPAPCALCFVFACL